ncbi:hypothetical protein IWZ01DRAFT_245630 [Phyllosticta capitalensis]
MYHAHAPRFWFRLLRVAGLKFAVVFASLPCLPASPAATIVLACLSVWQDLGVRVNRTRQGGALVGRGLLRRPLASNVHPIELPASVYRYITSCGTLVPSIHACQLSASSTRVAVLYPFSPCLEIRIQETHPLLPNPDLAPKRSPGLASLCFDVQVGQSLLLSTRFCEIFPARMDLCLGTIVEARGHGATGGQSVGQVDWFGGARRGLRCCAAVALDG